MFLGCSKALKGELTGAVVATVWCGDWSAQRRSKATRYLRMVTENIL